MVRSRKELAVFLSKLKTFNKPSVYLEQYSSDSEVAAILLWRALLSGDIEDKCIVDYGAGTGILGIGALLLGAKFVYFIDVDSKMKDEISENLKILTDNWEIDIEDKWEFVCKDITQSNSDLRSEFRTEHQNPAQLIAVMNPPFGTRRKHIDKLFLEKALELSSIIYTMHKSSTKAFVEAYSDDNHLEIAWSEDVSFPLKNKMVQHRKKIERIEVTLYNLRKQAL